MDVRSMKYVTLIIALIVFLVAAYIFTVNRFDSNLHDIVSHDETPEAASNGLVEQPLLVLLEGFHTNPHEQAHASELARTESDRPLAMRSEAAHDERQAG